MNFIFGKVFKNSYEYVYSMSNLLILYEELKLDH